MGDFTQVIDVNGKKIRFSLRKISLPQSVKYYVRASGKGNVLASFEIVHRRGKWKILPPAPDWILQMESQLVQLIEKGK